VLRCTQFKKEDFDRKKASLKLLRKISEEYFQSKWGESLEKIEKKAKNGNDSSLVTLIEWDKTYLHEPWIIERIVDAEREILKKPRDKKSRDFLDLLSKSLKKIGQLPKVKKHLRLLYLLQMYARANNMKDINKLATEARKAREKLPDLPEYEILYDKKALLVRFIKTHSFFILPK